MEVRVYAPQGGSVGTISFSNYYSNVVRELERLGVRVVVVGSPEACGGGVCWYPFSTPPLGLLRARGRLVVSLLGDYGFGVPRSDLVGGSVREVFRRLSYEAKVRAIWRLFRGRVDRVVTVSNYAKKTISKHLGIDPGRIYVAYHGVDFNIFNPGGEAVKLERPYFLHVSQYTPLFHKRKNVERILAAYSRVRVRPKPYLVLVIPGYPRDPGVEGVILIRRRLEPRQLAAYYRGALALVFPSLHEAFGMPVLEAMASGCPVITSSVTALPEIAGDAAVYVDPHSVDDIRDAMEAVAVDEDLRQRLRARGLRRARMFTWEQSARVHYRVFRELLE